MKNLKKLTAIMLLLFLVAGIYGCGAKKPSVVTTTYLEEIKKGTSGDFEKLLNKTLNKTDDENKDQAYDESTKKLINSMNKITYKINSEKIDGDSATVNVTLNGPDMSKVMKDFVNKAMDNALSQAFAQTQTSEEENKKLYDDMLSECLDNITYTERTGDIKLTKTDGQWKINTDDSLSKLLLGMDVTEVDTQNTDNN